MGPRTYRGLRASADRVKIWRVFFVLWED